MAGVLKLISDIVLGMRIQHSYMIDFKDDMDLLHALHTIKNHINDTRDIMDDGPGGSDNWEYTSIEELIMLSVRDYVRSHTKPPAKQTKKPDYLGRGKAQMKRD